MVRILILNPFVILSGGIEKKALKEDIDWNFEITEADPKRIRTIKVERLVGYYDENNDDKDHAVLGFLNKKNKNNNNSEGDSDDSNPQTR